MPAHPNIPALFRTPAPLGRGLPYILSVFVGIVESSGTFQPTQIAMLCQQCQQTCTYLQAKLDIATTQVNITEDKNRGTGKGPLCFACLPAAAACPSVCSRLLRCDTCVFVVRCDVRYLLVFYEYLHGVPNNADTRQTNALTIIRTTRTNGTGLPCYYH